MIKLSPGNSNTKEYWDGEWERGVKKFPTYTMNRVRWLVPEGSSVLDIGCGNGKFLRMLRVEKPVGELFGIDISSVAIDRMKAESGIDGLAISAENLDDFDKQFDVVTACHVMEHIENDVGLAKNIGRIAKKMAIIAVPNDCSYPEPTGEHVRKYNFETLSALFKDDFKTIKDCTRLNRELLKNHLIILLEK